MSEQVKFDSLLRMAVREMYTEQAEAIPSEKELEEILHPSPTFKEKINAVLRRENRSETFALIRKTASKAAVIFLVLFAMSFSTLLTAEAVRESIATTILEWHDKFTRIFIESDTRPDVLPEIRFNYIPEGFELVEEKSAIDVDCCFYTFANNDDMINIIISNTSLNNSDYIDNEHLEYCYIMIDDISGIWIYNEVEHSLLISKENISFNIIATISIEEIVQIYKNIEIL